MADSNEQHLRRLLPVGDDTVPALVVAAVCGRDRDAADGAAGDAAELLARARAGAESARDRQLVALTAAHLEGDDDRFDALVRDHLADHPDDVVAAWIAARRSH